MLLGAFMYTNSRIISSSQVEIIQDVKAYLKALGSKFIEERFKSAHSQLYFAVIILFVLLFIFQNFIIKVFLKYLFKFLSCQCCRKEDFDLALKNKRRDNFSQDIFKELEISNLTELYKRSCRDLNEYKEMLQTVKFNET